MMTNSVTAVTLVPDRPSASYTAGELITGHCIITVDGTVGFDQVEIRLVGKARVELPTNDSSSTNNNPDKTTGLERYVKTLSLLDLVYKPSTVYHNEMQTGKHDIGFSFAMPPNVPSSLDATMGFIRYKVKAKAGSEKNEIVLIVISSPNIPREELYLPIVENKSKTVGLLFGQPVLIHCEIPRTGFTLGTKVPVRCTVNNQSNRLITLKGALRQQIIFKANEEERTVTNKLASVSGTTIQAKSDQTYDLQIAVPINLPIVHNTCPLIMVKYLVSAKLKIPQAFDLRCDIPIVLTNQPIMENPGAANNGINPPIGLVIPPN